MTEVGRILASVTRAKITRVQRIRYVFEGSVSNDNGPLQITFDGGPLLRFDAGPDGELLQVDTTAWSDPFAEPLSDDNREYVRRSGKWTEFDVSGEPTYASLIGDTVHQVRLITLTDGKLVGVALVCASSELTASTAADNLHVAVR